MPTQKRLLFISYARADIERIRPLVDVIRDEIDFRGLPIELWMDVSNLQPGEQWELSIQNALESSIGFLFFVTPRALHSSWIQHELEIAMAHPDRFIIPIVLHKTPDLPAILNERQWIDFTDRQTPERISQVARLVANAIESYLERKAPEGSVVPKAEVSKIALQLAQEIRGPGLIEAHEGPLNSVFVVHGHSIQALTQLEDYLKSVEVEAIVLSRQDESAQSLFQKFMQVAMRAKFAIVLLGADDYGASRKQYEAVGVAGKALQFRAGQNVILELGFFYGRLGWENVFVLYQEPDKVYPNFERPSDLDGIVFNLITEAGWQKKLRTRLSAAGFNLK